MRKFTYVLNFVDETFVLYAHQYILESWKAFSENNVNSPKAELEHFIARPLAYQVQTFDLSERKYLMYENNRLLFANKDWTKVELYADEIVENDTLVLIAIYSYLVTRRTLLLHSSLVDYKGSGIMFLGPSGIGKTTQAELWNRYTGANILNGDRVFLRQNEDGFYGYGSPWHGSSPYYMNAKVKVKALVVLEQAPENTLRKLSGFEVMRGSMDQVFLPHWYPEAMEPCLDTLDALLTQIPVYHLACRPDEAAVRLLQKELNIE